MTRILLSGRTMGSAAVRDCVAQLRQYELLPPLQLAEVERLQDRFPEPKELARELVQRQWLTIYQARKLLQGSGPELVIGPYVILDPVGTGNMGTVYRARHRHLGRVVALKIIRSQDRDKSSRKERFLREIEAVSRLNHPNVIRDFYADQAGDRYYLAMEYVEGINLGRLVQKQGKLPVAQACDYIRQAALGLQHAHENSLVHRDVKPDNLLLTPGGQVKLLDLGLARIHEPETGTAGSHLTSVGAVVGTPDFISPEQSRNSHIVDHRTDLYSLGCTLYMLLTGQVPFPGGGAVEKLVAHRKSEPTPVEQLRPEVPAELAAVVRRLMAKLPEDRFATAAEVAEALRPFAEGQPPAAPADIQTPNVKDTLYGFHLGTMTLPKTQPDTAHDLALPAAPAAAAEPSFGLPLLLLGGLLALAAVVLGGFLALQVL